jgi:class 3 adenylate cyclase
MRLSILSIESFSSLPQFRKSLRHCGCGGADAERAARTALSIQRALAEVNRNNAGTGKPALNARIGIETGPVVVDAAGEIYGDAPNVAARVQALAELGAGAARRGPVGFDRRRTGIG